MDNPTGAGAPRCHDPGTFELGMAPLSQNRKSESKEEMTISKPISLKDVGRFTGNTSQLQN